MTRVLHTASISNVERVMCVKRSTKIIKSELGNEIEKDVFWSKHELSTIKSSEFPQGIRFSLVELHSHIIMLTCAENIQTDAAYLTRFAVLLISWLFQRTYALFRSLLFRNHLLLPVKLYAGNL